MSDRDRVLNAIREGFRQVNRRLDEKERLEFTETAPLFGEEGQLDSLGLVNLVVAVEEALEKEFELALSLADERALSARRSPFRDVSTLTDYALTLLDERKHA